MNRITALSFLGMTLLLTACDSTKTVLGLNRNENDEFAVLTTRPITLPPNFDELPSPVAKDSFASKDNSASDKARDAALSQFSHTVAHKQDSASASESELLKNAGAEANDPAIRQNLSKDSTADKKKNQSFVKDLLNIKDSGSEKTLDPFEEKKRLEETQS